MWCSPERSSVSPMYMPGPLADGLQALQQLDRIGGVGGAHGTPFTLVTARSARGRRRAAGRSRVSRGPPGDDAGRNAPAAPRSSDRTGAPRQSRSRNSSTQPSREPGVELVGGEQGRLASEPRTARHSASFDERDRAGSSRPQDACDASGRPAPRPAADRPGAVPRANVRGGARAAGAARTPPAAPPPIPSAAEYSTRIVGVFAGRPRAREARNRRARRERRAPVTAHGGSGNATAPRSTPRAPPVRRGARAPPARASERVCVPQGRAVAGEIVSARRPDAEHEAIQKPPPRRRRAGQRARGARARGRPPGRGRETSRNVAVFLAAPELAARRRATRSR